MDGSMRKKSSFEILALTFSSKLDWGSYMISFAKTASKKIRPLIRSMKFFSPEVGPFLHIAMHGILLSCLGWCYYLDLLDKLQKWISRTVGPSLVLLNPCLIFEM